MTSDTLELTLSPMMQQWKILKEKCPEALLLFRLGDFYEAFFEDAKTLSEAIDVVLTHRQSIPMSGIPHHQLETYLEKLIDKQYIVAIAEQIESPDQAKGLVRREITEIISPATFLNSKMKESNYYFASVFHSNSIFGLAFLELSTGEFCTLELETLSLVIDELAKKRPIELLISPKFQKTHSLFLEEVKNLFSFRLTIAHESRFEPSLAIQALKEQFGSVSLNGFGLDGHIAATTASGALLKYLKTDLCRHLEHLKSIQYAQSQEHLKIDHATLQHLELLYSSKDRLSLQEVLDHTATPMGSRTLEHFITNPLIDPDEIKRRHDAVESLSHEQHYRYLLERLAPVKDLQRVAKRIELGIINPKEMLSLKVALLSLFEISNYLKDKNLISLFPKFNTIDPLKKVSSLLESALTDSAPVKLNQGPVFKIGYNSDLDHLYNFKTNSETYLERYQTQLREELGIKTLKVGFNRAFGYFIEVSRAQSSSMPNQFTKLQTLVNNERFISVDLKQYEMKMATCESQIASLEESLFNSLKELLKIDAELLYEIAIEIGFLDVIANFSYLACKYQYVKPIVDHSSKLEILGGMHPILAQNDHHQFIPNDVHFDEKLKLKLITGPNMAGKSTYIRQTALLVIMAQIGSFVPAKKMHFGYFDHIFSRIGASDDLGRGLSTFMVEMSETANILNHATTRSLVILDEIGRGTSTYDGIAIASAVAEYLVSKKEKSPKTLFATHYFELTKLEQKFKEIKNFHVAIHEKGDDVTFLRKIIPGILDKSFGIHVAKLAGVPTLVINRAKMLLKELEQDNQKNIRQPVEEQLTLFQAIPSELTQIKDQILNLDLDALSPKEALKYLYQIQEDLKKI